MGPRRLVLLALVAAGCGAGDPIIASLRSSNPDASSGGSGGAAPDGGPTSGGAPARDGASPDARTADADAAQRDSSVEGGAVRDVSTPDAPSDVVAGPTIDCRCPGGPYDVTIVTGGGQTYVLSEPYQLFIYCPETAPMAAGTACSEIWRVSACAGASYGPPCIYFGVDLVTGPLLGHFKDASGATHDLLDVSLTVAPTSNGTATGDFAATFANSGGGSITVNGSFHACDPLVGGCPPGP